ncbi:hypothetical protein Tco_1007853 [Tanacetum coccineum]
MEMIAGMERVERFVFQEHDFLRRWEGQGEYKKNAKFLLFASFAKKPRRLEDPPTAFQSPNPQPVCIFAIR